MTGSAPILRQQHIDCAHGLMILYVMFYHICGLSFYKIPICYCFLDPLSFFMAWFFFKSGMYYKDRCFKDELLSGLKKLIIPALFFSFIGYLCYLLINHLDFSISQEIDAFYLFGAFHGNIPLWFLFSLFAVRLLYLFLQKCHINSFFIIIISLGLFYLDKTIGFRPYWTYYIPLGLLFYSIGLSLKDTQYNLKLIIFCIIIYFGLFFIQKDIDFLFGKFIPAIVAFPWALSGCILINALFKYIPCLCKKPLNFFGRHAMEYYCTHYIIVSLIGVLTKNINSVHLSIAIEFLIFAFYIILFALIIHFFKLKHIQWMFGRCVLFKG